MKKSNFQQNAGGAVFRTIRAATSRFASCGNAAAAFLVPAGQKKQTERFSVCFLLFLCAPARFATPFRSLLFLNRINFVFAPCAQGGKQRENTDQSNKGIMPVHLSIPFRRRYIRSFSER